MRSDTLKKIILLFTLLISLIVLAQLYWLNKLYSFEQRQFTTNVVKAIRGLFEDLALVNEPVVHLQQVVERPDANTFLVKIDTIPEKDSLSYYMLAELEDFDVFSDCMITAYDHKTKNNAYSFYLPVAGSRGPDSVDPPPITHTDHDYISLYFPHRKEYILNEMRWWITSGIILLLVFGGLAASLFYLYRQKFLNEVQSDFIKNVTHEFQTPLTTLKLGLDMISRPNIRKQPEKLDKYISVMHAQTEYLQHHLENLVRVIRSDALGMQVNKERVSPSQLIEAAIHQLHFLIAEKSAIVKFEPPQEDVTISADKANLYLAILNVISNALKFSPNPQVQISTSVNEKFYSISIKDNGIGIEKKYLKSLFRKFYRVPTGDVHNVKGLGLGLYFVKKIISIHHGRVEVSSIPGIGTEFRLHLPV
jgi:two-component system, OmpR family, phosphate regulon sensor histidine kinase PhoR